jgi:3-oxoacyl-[acyl-carrier-protein] synthase-3
MPRRVTSEELDANACTIAPAPSSEPAACAGAISPAAPKPPPSLPPKAAASGPGKPPAWPMGDIDCLVAASGTMDQGMPCNAALIHRELGLSDRAIPAFDVNASCLGFLAALDTLAWPIAAGRYHRVLVVAADIASCGLDWSTLDVQRHLRRRRRRRHPRAQRPDGASRLLAADLSTLSQGADLCRIPAGGSRHHPSRIDQPFEERWPSFRMDGKGVFRLAAQHLPDFVDRLLARAGLTPRPARLDRARTRPATSPWRT